MFHLAVGVVVTWRESVSTELPDKYLPKYPGSGSGWSCSCR
jgi:hypothetical protein